ncbi:uncharacterized protein THITE_2120219 [Thermothielavioides terrestris NRRL 8126]|uniref:Uncharacterized protein n=1 Tax=Thermothielavioides terrestris (strain ATCC 38088 / NRRL 8126) TaxID=578455 RepID=G2R9U5_THETT|nr:uncharacterized protein THITE_2120219 [Thermothielavioides terrestris NRRL 8126]AEO69586.1 hypothetical protein THITE_2120219 [Thermothielavioides terrestris NRRL 8126]
MSADSSESDSSPNPSRCRASSESPKRWSPDWSPSSPDHVLVVSPASCSDEAVETLTVSASCSVSSPISTVPSPAEETLGWEDGGATTEETEEESTPARLQVLEEVQNKPTRPAQPVERSVSPAEQANALPKKEDIRPIPAAPPAVLV